MSQTTDTVLMVRPVIIEKDSNTGNNDKPASGEISSFNETEIIKEFDNFIHALQLKEINIMEILDSPQPPTPDSIFPNIWLSTHTKAERDREGMKIDSPLLKSLDAYLDLPDAETYIVLYPMSTAETRIEKYKTPTKILKEHFQEKAFFIDLSEFEKEDKYLDALSSMVIDRENKIVYASRSSVTNEEVIQRFCILFNYRYFLFDNVLSDDKYFVHTDKIFSLGKQFAIVCMDAINDTKEKTELKKILKLTGKEIIEISVEQVKHFAGNIIEINTQQDGINQPVYIISQNAKNSLSDAQLKRLSDYAIIISPDIPVIEKFKKNSVRDMIAEIF